MTTVGVSNIAKLLEEYAYRAHPCWAGFKAFKAVFLIQIRTLHGCSLLESAGTHSPELASLQ